MSNQCYSLISASQGTDSKGNPTYNYVIRNPWGPCDYAAYYEMLRQELNAGYPGVGLENPQGYATLNLSLLTMTMADMVAGNYISILSQPQSCFAGSSLGNVVVGEFAVGQPMDDGTTVTLSLMAGPGKDILEGTTTAVFDGSGDGNVTFTDLSISQPGTYTLLNELKVRVTFSSLL